MCCCFVFVLETVLIIQQCFSYSWAMLAQHQGLFCFSHCHTNKWDRGAGEPEREHRQDSWPKLTQEISQTIWHHSQHIKLWKKEGNVWSGGIYVLKVTVMHDGALMSWTQLILCLSMGSSEWILFLALFGCIAFALPLKMSLSQTGVFSLSPFSFCTPHDLGSSEQAALWGWVASWA